MADTTSIAISNPYHVLSDMTTTNNGALSFSSMQSKDEVKLMEIGFNTGPLLELDQALLRLDESKPYFKKNSSESYEQQQKRKRKAQQLKKNNHSFNKEFVTQKLAAAWEAHPDYTLKIIFKTRDCRGGKGEREAFRFCLQWLQKTHPEDLKELLHYIPFYGRWDDVLVVPGGAELMAEQLKQDLQDLELSKRSTPQSSTSSSSSFTLGHDSSANEGAVFEKKQDSMKDTTFPEKETKTEAETQATDQKPIEEKLSKLEIENEQHPDVQMSRKRKGISIASKWAPSEGGKRHKKFPDSIDKICAVLGFNGTDDGKLAQYRKKCLSKLRAKLNMVETNMCSQKWNQIDFSKVPSRAMKKFNKAFAKHDATRYQDWLSKLSAGDKSVKVNAKTLFVHEIVSEYLKNKQKEVNLLLEAQWKVLVEEVTKMGSFKDSLVLSDVSSSMAGLPMEVSIALGLIISTVTKAPFTNQIITFSEKPLFHEVHGETLMEKVKNVSRMQWSNSTNLQAVFNLIVNEAKRHNVSKDDMPKRLFILSDMQFNQACTTNDKTNFEQMTKTFTDAGYDAPQVVFWNLSSNSRDSYPVQSDTLNTVLLSGFSIHELKTLVSEGEIPTTGKVIVTTPWDNLKTALDNIRYAPIQSLGSGSDTEN